MKGDVARMIFYMDVRYEGELSGEPDLEIFEDYQDKSSKAPNFGKLSTLLQWHLADPVSKVERKRNDLVYKYQGNRNPFIDHPEYVSSIWNSSQREFINESLALKASPLQNAETIQVGTYNLYWLGTDMRVHKRLRTEEEVNLLADLVTKELDLEIIVFQEVNIESQDYIWFEERMNENGYKLIEGESGGTQRIVIAYKKDKIKKIGMAIELPVSNYFKPYSSCSSGGLRKPLSCHFKVGNFDFLVIGVHLKAQPGGNCSDVIRKIQAKEISSYINNYLDEKDEKDIILLGDFNAEGKDKSILSFYYSNDFSDLTTPDKITAESGEDSYLSDIFGSVIDHIMVNTEYTTEWKSNSTTIFNPESMPLINYKWDYSDHVPVWTNFIITSKDDD